MKNDLSIIIEIKSREDFKGEDWVKIFPDKSATKAEIKIKYNNAVIKELHLVYTDGNRYIFPLPRFKDGNVYFNEDELAIGRIFSDHDDIDRYLEPVKSAFLKQIQKK